MDLRQRFGFAKCEVHEAHLRISTLYSRVSKLFRTRRYHDWTHFGQPLDHLIAGNPVVVIPRQPTLRCIALVVFLHVILIRSLIRWANGSAGVSDTRKVSPISMRTNIQVPLSLRLTCIIQRPGVWPGECLKLIPGASSRKLP